MHSITTFLRTEYLNWDKYPNWFCFFHIIYLYIFAGQLPGTPSEHFVDRVTQSTEWFDEFKEEEQTWFVRMLLSRMHHHQHGSINSYLKPILQRDFITLLPKKGLDHVAETILSYLDAKSLW